MSLTAAVGLAGRGGAAPGLGGSSRRRSRSGLARPDHDRQAVSILCAGGQRNVRRGVTEPILEAGNADPLRRAPAYRLTPMSCPPRAGRLKAATSWAMSSNSEIAMSYVSVPQRIDHSSQPLVDCRSDARAISYARRVSVIPPGPRPCVIRRKSWFRLGHCSWVPRMMWFL